MPSQQTPMPAALAALAATLAEWRRRARSRALLAGMNERELLDIGLSRSSAMLECQKPFWSE